MTLKKFKQKKDREKHTVITLRHDIQAELERIAGFVTSEKAPKTFLGNATISIKDEQGKDIEVQRGLYVVLEEPVNEKEYLHYYGSAKTSHGEFIIAWGDPLVKQPSC